MAQDVVRQLVRDDDRDLRVAVTFWKYFSPIWTTAPSALASRPLPSRISNQRAAPRHGRDRDADRAPVAQDRHPDRCAGRLRC
ncbi:hypothetical protein QP185_15430 [Sphingomonas aerolata]|uniref:hypothetical protein n=1 Tax=Sphingomonas aerolata TaxID=185951 RepID=UPI002FE2980B